MNSDRKGLPDYAYFHAMAYVVFADALVARGIHLPNQYAQVPLGTTPMLYEVCEATEDELREKATTLGRTVELPLSQVDTTIPMAGCEYNAVIGPLRMAVQYNIQTDTMKAALCLYVGKPRTNGAGE